MGPSFLKLTLLVREVYCGLNEETAGNGTCLAGQSYRTGFVFKPLQHDTLEILHPKPTICQYYSLVSLNIAMLYYTPPKPYKA